MKTTRWIPSLSIQATCRLSTARRIGWTTVDADTQSTASSATDWRSQLCSRNVRRVLTLLVKTASWSFTLIFIGLLSPQSEIRSGIRGHYCSIRHTAAAAAFSSSGRRWWKTGHQSDAMPTVAALHQGASGQMTWHGRSTPWLMTRLEDLLCFGNECEQKIKMLPYLTALFVSFWQWNNQRRGRPVFWEQRLNKGRKLFLRKSASGDLT